MKKYTKDEIEELREACCRHDAEQVILSDTVYDILLDGCSGWLALEDEVVINYADNHNITI